MLRLMNSFKNLGLDAYPITSNLVNVNVVRWRRKPRKPMWKGTAKSKIFRVSPRPQIPEEETVEIKRLYNKYRTELKTITKFLTLKYNEEFQQKEDTDLKRKEFEEDLRNCMRINDEWNAKQKVLREARSDEELEEAISKARQQKLITEKKREEHMKLQSEIVSKEIESSKHFILPEMLDAEIEKALANPVDHNFALDLDGNKIHGRETIPPPVDKKVATSQTN
ncbi:probable 28S ribosomal protein S26, mitochondrial [Coccinella septempunctata]|uniref:probable 28S ribosomal protein S26, mitochondrial n=1 Tax=Coccinella septempunctata TaxID=41139 RepID=UPI001D089C20|nr:probable 28S ribosomal protein S26, mitochondrial [Coccinella septempunctata]